MDSSASKNFELTAAVLHIIAMTLMLMDHLWATLLPAREWLTCAGRVAFPIFAFMAVEGYFHTRSFKKYILLWKYGKECGGGSVVYIRQ
mgnify:CR=1 FL=1